MWARGLDERAAKIRFEPPPGTRVARRHAAVSRPRRAHLHRAQPAVPDGQPVGVQRLRPSHLHGPRRRANAGVPRRGAPRRHRRGSRRLRPRRREDGARSAQRLRRVRALRRQHLHVHRRLPAVGGRRRDGTSQQHDRDVAGRPSRDRIDLLDTWRTNSSTPGTSSASGRRRSSPSTSTMPTSPASSGSPRASRTITARWSFTRAGLTNVARFRAATIGRAVNDVLTGRAGRCARPRR